MTNEQITDLYHTDREAWKRAIDPAFRKTFEDAERAVKETAEAATTTSEPLTRRDSTVKKEKPQESGRVPESAAYQEAARQKQYGIPCTLEDVTKYFLTVEETNLLAKHLITGINHGIAEVIGRPFKKRLEDLENKTASMAHASAVAQTEDRMNGFEKRLAANSNTTLFAAYDHRIGALTSKVDKLTQALSAANKKIANLEEKAK